MPSLRPSGRVGSRRRSPILPGASPYPPPLVFFSLITASTVGSPGDPQSASFSARIRGLAPDCKAEPGSSGLTHARFLLFGVILKKGSINAMRFLTAVSMEQPEMLETVSRELGMRIWSRDEDITESQSILAAAEKAGMSTEQVQRFLEKISTAQVKNKLKETTEAACNYGAFGLPTTVAHVDGKTYILFGSDRMELLAYLLGEKWMGPVPTAQYARL